MYENAQIDRTKEISASTAVTIDEREHDQEIVLATWSAARHGQDIVPLRVEATQSRGLSGVVLIGGTGKICEDGKERAKVALERLGWSAPSRKILMSVSPGELKIDRSHLDLAFCICLAGVLEHSSWVIKIKEWMFTAEVGINGELRPVNGVVAWASVAMKLGLKGIIVALDNYDELASMSELMNVDQNAFKSFGFANLKDVMEWLKTGEGRTIEVSEGKSSTEPQVNFDDMDLSPSLRLLALVAASGMHSVLLRGSPGTGKSMFAKRLPSILPRMNHEEHLYALSLHSSYSAKVEQGILAGIPPFRAPHHYTSVAALLGTAQRPGELSLASGGVLFLDELPEFRRDVLEGLREPLETGEICVSRSKGSYSWQAQILLIAAANNCPCGWNGSRRRRCECTANQLYAYRNRLSGPLLDRIDIHINMEEPANQMETLFASHDPPKSKGDSGQAGLTLNLKDKVLRCRQRAAQRARLTGCSLNRDIPARLVLDTFGLVKTEALRMIDGIIPKHASARSLIRCLKVARTIADVEDMDQVAAHHIKLAWEWQAWSAARMRGEVLRS